MSFQSQQQYGKVFLIGAGPGAADLITVRGARLLAEADVVLHDALVTEDMLALCPQAVKIAVGKRCGKLSAAQTFINKQIIDSAAKYALVVRLKGGDPMMFGRADEELRALEEHGIEVAVVPGITAALAAAASTQQPLTKRGVSRSVAFFTSSTAPDSLRKTACPTPIPWCSTWAARKQPRPPSACSPRDALPQRQWWSWKTAAARMNASCACVWVIWKLDWKTAMGLCW
jgi:uroporphyrin-III C-methyltransferase